MTSDISSVMVFLLDLFARVAEKEGYSFCIAVTLIVSVVLEWKKPLQGNDRVWDRWTKVRSPYRNRTGTVPVPTDRNQYKTRPFSALESLSKRTMNTYLYLSPSFFCESDQTFQYTSRGEVSKVAIEEREVEY